jgi:hypothetical protein
MLASDGPITLGLILSYHYIIVETLQGLSPKFFNSFCKRISGIPKDLSISL